jgi:hypothetical protein
VNRGQPGGQYRLEYRLAGSLEPACIGTLEMRVEDLGSLGRLFARRLISLLSSKCSSTMPGGDAWVGQVLDRAIAECRAQRWHSALGMLTVALKLEPENPRARAFERYAREGLLKEFVAGPATGSLANTHP